MTTDEPDTYSVPRIEIAYEVRLSDDTVASSFDDADEAFAYVDANGGNLTVWRVTSEKLVRERAVRPPPKMSASRLETVLADASKVIGLPVRLVRHTFRVAQHEMLVTPCDEIVCRCDLEFLARGYSFVQTAVMITHDMLDDPSSDQWLVGEITEPIMEAFDRLPPDQRAILNERVRHSAT